MENEIQAEQPPEPLEPCAPVIVPDWGLVAKEVGERGRGVFAGRDIPEGQLVIKFDGPVHNKDTCPDFSEALQVGPDTWLWSSGGLDDLVNHSCRPNTGLYEAAGNTYLVCIRPIAAGEELSFDYSTSMAGEPWSLDGCCCGEACCRGVVGNFVDLPLSVQQHYARLDVLPLHVRLAAAERGIPLNYPTKKTVTRPSPSTSVVVCGSMDAEECRSVRTELSDPSRDAACASPADRLSPVATDAAPAPVEPTVPDWGLVAKDVGERGRGVFAGKDIPEGQLVIKFDGPVHNKETCPDFSEALQVGPDTWLWSSGGLDDLVNHSCRPNTGLYEVAGNTYLVCIRPITAGEELSFDYSTSMAGEPWSLDGCCCGEACCRGVVGNFVDLPLSVQQHYARLGVLPLHVRLAAAERSINLEYAKKPLVAAPTKLSMPTPDRDEACAAPGMCHSPVSLSACGEAHVSPVGGVDEHARCVDTMATTLKFVAQSDSDAMAAPVSTQENLVG